MTFFRFVNCFVSMFKILSLSTIKWLIISIMFNYFAPLNGGAFFVESMVNCELRVVDQSV
jgi:hypothetical protein